MCDKPFFLKCIQQGVPFPAEERFRFHFAGLEDGNRCAGLAVIGNVQIIDGDVGLAEIVENLVQVILRKAPFVFSANTET